MRALYHHDAVHHSSQHGTPLCLACTVQRAARPSRDGAQPYQLRRSRRRSALHNAAVTQPGTAAHHLAVTVRHSAMTARNETTTYPTVPPRHRTQPRSTAPSRDITLLYLNHATRHLAETLHYVTEQDPHSTG